MGFPGGSDDKESTCKVGDLSLIPVLGRSSGGGHGYPLQYPCLENPVDRGAWRIQSTTERLSTAQQTRVSPPSWTSLPPSPTRPLWIVTERQSELPASGSQFPLAICLTYNNAYASVLLPQLVPPSPSPLCPQVSCCLRLHCCPADRLISTIFLDST